jgi:hypothetical protein
MGPSASGAAGRNSSLSSEAEAEEALEEEVAAPIDGTASSPYSTAKMNTQHPISMGSIYILTISARSFARASYFSLSQVRRTPCSSHQLDVRQYRNISKRDTTYSHLIELP